MPSHVIPDSNVESLFIIAKNFALGGDMSSKIFTLFPTSYNFFLFLRICVLTIRLAKQEILTRSPTLPPGILCSWDVLFDDFHSYWCCNSNNFIDGHGIFLWYVTTTSMIWVFLNATYTNVVPSCIIFNSFRLGHWCNFAAFFMIVQVVLNMFCNLGCHFFLDLFYGLLHCTRNSYLNFCSNLGEKLAYTSRNAAVETAFEHFVNPDKNKTFIKRIWAWTWIRFGRFASCLFIMGFWSKNLKLGRSLASVSFDISKTI